ncbi:MAG: FHA domain-containing protein [Polyangiaceae bacterium]|nr:FHA domain-containing protein [Polyangiaceae bacterium]
MGTAWLILLDSGASIGGRFDEAKAVANAFVNSKRENDIFKVMYFNDAGVVYTLDWTNDKAKAASFIDATVTKPFPASGRGVRELGDIIKQAAIDGFRELGNVGQTVKAPMHQAMVVLSSGDGGSGSSSSVGQAGALIAQYMTKGRFPEDNLALPKMPVPVVSVWFPAGGMEERFEQARAFMQNLANTEIGGFFSVIRDKSLPRGDRIVTAVRNRFDAMWIAKWQASCVAPTIQQTFNFGFDPALGLAGDGSYKDVPVGIDPKSWPLDIDIDTTTQEADKNPMYPGGKVTIFGNFCWEGHKERAELFLLPKNQEVPATLEGVTLEDAEKARKTLIGQGLKATVIDAGKDSATFELPDSEKFLSGKGESFTARVVLHDNETLRTSAITKDKIITVKAVKAPLSSWLKSNTGYLVIGGIVFAGVVLILLLVTAFRSGGKRRGGAVVAAPPPRPGGGGGGGAVAAKMPDPAMSYAAPPAPPPPAPPPPAPGPAFVQRATLSGAAGIFTVLPGVEMKAGRDGALCQILLAEPRVSGTHATMKIDGGQLFVRDDNSNNGTTLNGQRLPPGVWTPVTNGAQLRFGPIEFAVGLE